jgi:hypothetical protein
VTDTAALANEVEATLENALESITADPALVAAAQETLVPAEAALGRLRDALAAAAAELRDQAARREFRAGVEHAGQPHPSAHAAEVAGYLRALADRLEEPDAWQAVDRVVHELVSDLLVGALALARRGAPADVTARAVALGVLAGHDALWPGAAPRLGCAHGYDGLIALVRTAARAA